MHLRASITPLASGAPRPPAGMLSTYGAQWTFSLLAPVKFRAGSAPDLGTYYMVVFTVVYD